MPEFIAHVLWRSVQRRRFSLSNVFAVLPVRPTGLLHLGGNIGSEAAEYSELGVRRVVWVEGCEEYYDILLGRIKDHPEHTAHNVFVSDTDGERLEFFHANNTGSSTTLRPTAAHRVVFDEIAFTGSSTHTAVRLDTYFAAAPEELDGCTMVVVDLEGAELKALRGLGSLLDQFTAVLCEVSLTELFDGGPRLHDVDSFLRSKGFVRRRLWLGQASGEALYLRGGRASMRGVLMGIGSRVRQIAYELGVYRVRWALRRIVVRWLNLFLVARGSSKSSVEQS